jgi:hypothetical protein
MKKRIVSLLVIGASCMLMLTACEFEAPIYPRSDNPALITSISIDGQLTAASATSAKTDFAQFLSLYDLSPFSVSVSDTAANESMYAVAA